MEKKYKARQILEKSESISSTSETQVKKVIKSTSKKSSKDSTPVKFKSSTLGTTQNKASVTSSIKNIAKENLVGNKSSSSSSNVPLLPSKSKISSKSEIKSKSSTIKGNNKELLGLNSPRLKYVKSQGSGQGKSVGIKNKPLNVTIHSPPRRDTTQKTESNTSQLHEEKIAQSSSGDGSSIKHQRYRTRTLEPSEIKILKDDVKSMNDKSFEKLSKVIKSDLQKLSVTKSESFYVPLEETFQMPAMKTKSPVESESSDSYEEDFELYESDFESFISSHNDSSSDKSSLHDDYEDSTINNFKKEANIDVLGEADLDSGNYDLKIDSKADDNKNDMEFDKIPYTFLKTRDTDSAKMPSYSDEGFDENSGGFSSTSNSANSKLYDSQVKAITVDGNSTQFAVKHSILKQKVNYYQQRARDLSGLITFDNIGYSLFEISPIPYDVFIKTYGKSNVSQKCCQTNEDYIDDFTQTEIILTQNKWSQFPVDYSNFDIATTKVGKNKKKTSYDCIYKDRDLIESIDTIQQIEITPMNNPIDVYRSQRLGCSIDININNFVNATAFYSDQNQYKKLYNFVDKVGKTMLRYLKETTSRNSISLEKKNSDYCCSDHYSRLLSTVSNKVKYLSDRPPIMMTICSNNINLLLTVHAKCKSNPNSNLNDMIYSRTLICIWDLSIGIMEPSMILLSVDNISSCEFYNGLNGFVVAGTIDGVTCFWDLEEHEMWHNLIQNTINNQSMKQTLESQSNTMKLNIDHLVLRCCTFTSFSMDFNEIGQNYYGSVVSILVDQFEQDSYSKFHDSGNSYNQVCTLQEYGLLTVWTVIKSKANASNQLSNADSFVNQSTQSYWSNMKFYKHLVLNLQEPFKHVSALNISALEKKLFKKSLSHQEFPLTNVKRKNSYKRSMTPRGANDDQDDSLTSVRRLDLEPSDRQYSEKTLSLQLLSPIYEWESKLICSTFKLLVDSNGTQHFLFGCSSGCIFHYDQRGNMLNPQVYVCSGTSSLVKCIEICHHDESFFLVGSDNCIHLFSILNPKPLKSFFSENENIENCGRFYKDEIICIQWSKLRPCLFFTLSNKGCLTIWDLLKSDLVPIESEVLRNGNDLVLSMKLLLDTKQTPNEEYLVLLYVSGCIEKHTLSRKLTSSIHPNKEMEAVVLKRYMKLL